jgi:hypothetical protein
MRMSLGLALPSRPRAVRIVGASVQSAASGHEGALSGQLAPPLPNGLAWTGALDRFVRDEPKRAFEVLDDWLTETASADGEAHHVHG